MNAPAGAPAGLVFPAARAQNLTQRKLANWTCGDACNMQTPSHFDQLLQAAAAEPEPQRLLFVFASAELPDDATSDQRQRFAAGAGGNLTPLMCVDKGSGEWTNFDQLLAESQTAGPPWHVVFAAGLAGRNGQAPSAQQVERALEAMVERVRGGMIGSLLALDGSGQRLDFV